MFKLSIMDFRNLDEKINKIPYEKRLLISNIFFVLIIVLLYFGVFLGLLTTILFNSINFFFFLYIIFFIFIVVYKIFSPKRFERIKYDLEKLARNIENPSEKRYSFRILMNDLNKMVKLKNEGYDKIVFKTIRDYFSNILIYLIFSEQERILKIIKEELSKLSKSQDVHSLHENFLSLNKEIIKLKEFRDLYVAYPKLGGVNLENPFRWFPTILEDVKDKRVNKLKKFFYYLEENGVIRVILIIIVITVSGWVLDKIGLLNWATNIFEKIPRL